MEIFPAPLALKLLEMIIHDETEKIIQGKRHRYSIKQGVVDAMQGKIAE